jgi:hypothetical protein
MCELLGRERDMFVLLTCSSPRDHVHHGGFNFEEAASVKEAAHVVDDRCSRLEDSAHAVVQHEVKIALPTKRRNSAVLI